MPPKEAPKEEIVEEKKKEKMMSLPRRQPAAGSARVNPATLELRKEVMRLPTTKSYKEIKLY